MRHGLLALISAIALLTAACGTTVEGTAVKGTGGPAAPTLDFNRLDAGRYPTTPRDPLGVAGDVRRGVVLEAQRMANHVIGAWEVDPALTGSFGFGALVLPKAEMLALIGPANLAAAAARHDYVNGFAAARTEKDKRVLLNAVLRFADEEAAKAAADDMGQAALAQRTPEPTEKFEVPGHPEAQAVSYTGSHRAGGKFGAVRAFTAHGPYVLMQLAEATGGVEDAAQLVAKAIDLQGPEIDRFRATDISEFPDISIDPTGLLARTIPLEAPDPTLTKNTTYEQRGALHFQSDPARTSKLFSDTGVETVSMAGTNVYQTRDHDGAKKIVEDFFAEVTASGKPANPVPNMPDSRCVGLGDGGFYCLAAADAYAIETTAPNLLAAQQMAAAQYIMLMS
ncbi:Uncharacterised protein [Mycolicibacterium phlei]|jgi:hypothetical protein|uniref:Uncharacterized protein n=1 Tax=Mycolicibacterium phlei DSM 43239 = CCUG 21000 TaxID=1226750 RepID=A0A5N5UYG3_MYCPH|nr:hypothetical protein [Mycolicibacterium phlei]VEG07004.1 Uncharacterised protein [Mycobacteroides chelonae]AMO58872.1 hypothetical protein MPHLCCUG_00026 [Mycolicibacterium phlei]KAB7754596.1 hypothetical protein MPHL21000_15720 [Mycolicibacterium phlei DSM 43239 = CCUG 21000]KXW59912.1 hypothetical protein MPHL43070_07255 [Mycolicibacterium phlei DSM 43070]KXW65241.1 hypothetical protein MPHL43239_11540 [Mycolicibacterium phlei DSM 43239 = CCUG 21000]